MLTFLIIFLVGLAQGVLCTVLGRRLGRLDESIRIAKSHLILLEESSRKVKRMQLDGTNIDPADVYKQVGYMEALERVGNIIIQKPENEENK